MLKSIIEGLFAGHPERKDKAKRRLDLLDSSTAIVRSGSFEESEDDLGFPEAEACKLFEQCQLTACFYPGIDAEILRNQKYNWNPK